MANIAETVRLAPCRKLLSGSNSDACRPADDIVDPVAVYSAERAQEIGEQVLYRDGHKWISRQIVTSLSRYYRWGDTFVVDTPGGRKIGIVGHVRQDFTGGTQSFSVEYIA